MFKISHGKWQILLVGLTFVSSILAISCVQSTEDDKAAAGYAKWQNHKPEVYQYTYHEICFCSPKNSGQYTATATKDSVLKVIFSDSTIAYHDIQGYLIDSLFKMIEAKKNQQYDKGVFVYDDIYGYPKKVNIDYIEQAVDDEWGMTVDSFKVLSSTVYHPQGIHFQFNKTAYTVGETVKFEIFFKLTDTLFSNQCGGEIPKFIQKKAGNEWKIFDAQICMTFAPQDPLKIKPNTIFSDTYKTREDGYYRLQVQYWTNSKPDEQIAVWSDSFFVAPKPD